MPDVYDQEPSNLSEQHVGDPLHDYMLRISPCKPHPPNKAVDTSDLKYTDTMSGDHNLIIEETSKSFAVHAYLPRSPCKEDCTLHRLPAYLPIYLPIEERGEMQKSIQNEDEYGCTSPT
jgi:hypothetical protein